MSARRDGPIESDELTTLFAPVAPFAGFVIAVSGGPDSTALLQLAHRWWLGQGRDLASLLAVTVDHGLRPESAGEAVSVAHQAQAIGVPHRIVRWTDPAPRSGVQAAARAARYRLLFEAADGLASVVQGRVAILTAHTADDQAETIVMRLARGSGVDGLAAIPAWSGGGGEEDEWPVVLRPLLEIPRRRLMATLEIGAIPFVDDPSNRDRRFERVRIREAMPMLAELGLTREALVRSARRLRSAREVLEWAADDLESRALTTVGDLVWQLDRAALAAAPAETAVRLVRRVLARAGGTARAADLETVERAIARLMSDTTRPTSTLGGCIVDCDPRTEGRLQPHIAVYREPDRGGGLARLSIRPGESRLWDGRFVVAMCASPPHLTEVGPLSTAWTDCLARHPGLAALGLPAPAARGAPAFFDADGLVACPPLSRLAQVVGEDEAAAFLAGPQSVDRDGRTVRLYTANLIRPGPRTPWWENAAEDGP